jgi:DNA mismatch repair protein MutS
MAESDLTPLMRQYQEIKKAHQDSIVFFRVGDFYEMFFSDAEEASKILNITLTSREKTSPNPVPLCGIPYHAANGYISKLLKHGRNVALCEQVEDPKLAKGLVRREVVRLYTPGTLIDPELLDSNQSNYLCCISLSSLKREIGYQFGLAVVDLSTGEFFISEFFEGNTVGTFFDEIVRLSPQEILIPEESADYLIPLLSELSIPRIAPLNGHCFDPQSSTQTLTTHCRLSQLKISPLSNLSLGIYAAGALLGYIRETQPTLDHQHIQPPSIRQSEQEMHLDSMTIRNLELVKSFSHDSQGPTLLKILDHTLTSMGSRLLRQWIVRPLLNIQEIQNRQESVSEFTHHLKLRIGIREGLKTIQDLERLSSRMGLGTANPRELLALQQSLLTLPLLHSLLGQTQSPILRNMSHKWDNLEEVPQLIEQAILPTAPVLVRDGGIIKEGFNSELDTIRETATEGKQWIAELETREKQQTGIESLKIKYNSVFGYYIEITKSNLSRVPTHFIRKQTLANAERFTTVELKTLEGQVSHASSQLLSLEQDLFSRIRQNIATFIPRIQAISKQLAQLDVLCSLSEVASRNRYTCPEIHNGGKILISDGRHPVIEHMGLPGGFIPNDTTLDLDSHRLLIITGPNMAGKSTYLRQTALIVLMTHLGSFVPASKAHIGVVDRIFTRVGASDNLVGGQSTFMVEMTETSKILESASQRSLILLDEIGRGTSTYDGLSIAWAIAEFIQDKNLLGARTLFATHYHEMSALEDFREGIKNFTVSVKEEREKVIFLRKIIPGKADRSYGIHVATLAGLPQAVINRAKEVLHQLECSDSKDSVQQLGLTTPKETSLDPSLPPPHPIINEVKQMDLFSMSPLEALNRLAEIQSRLDKDHS